ncbi:hypothetical protein BD289DRAFT_74433 [Coniella lustricola]|uniref:Rhodopsin domain-containing protein n=1 Tax=Coniella lustricola TaxID=2025994 RepID=A0A2T3AHM0_9PEZI|nr:hypothetical protein BD289DRAFT_74433 [Coniella lustricola]
MAVLVPAMSKTCIMTPVVWNMGPVLNMVTDVIICVLPMRLVQDLKLPKKQKFILNLVFGVGLIACAISISRIYYINTRSNQDVIWTGAFHITLCMVETNCAFYCAGVPTLRPLLGPLVSWFCTVSRSTLKSTRSSSKTPWSTGGNSDATTVVGTRSRTEPGNDTIVSEKWPSERLSKSSVTSPLPSIRRLWPVKSLGSPSVDTGSGSDSTCIPPHQKRATGDPALALNPKAAPWIDVSRTTSAPDTVMTGVSAGGGGGGGSGPPISMTCSSIPSGGDRACWSNDLEKQSICNQTSTVSAWVSTGSGPNACPGQEDEDLLTVPSRTRSRSVDTGGLEQLYLVEHMTSDGESSRHIVITRSTSPAPVWRPPPEAPGRV